MNWTEEEYQEYLKLHSFVVMRNSLVQPHAQILADNTQNEAKMLGPDKPSKYHNQRTKGYPSKKHAQYADQLAIRQKAGEVWFWLEEVPFKLPGFYTDKKGRKRPVMHRVDFMVFYDFHSPVMKNWELVEIKGRDLPMGKLKRKQVEDIYKVRITVI